MKKTKKCVALTLVVTNILSGCGIQAVTDTDIPIELGENNVALQSGITDKYIEHQNKMPYENGVEDFISLDKDLSGNMHIISRNEEFVYQDYVMSPNEGEDTVYEKKEISWLHEVASDYNSWVIDVRVDAAGNEVACVGTADGKWMIANDENRNMIDDCPGGIAITADNHVILPYNVKGSVVDWDGEVIYDFEKGISPSTVSQETDTYQTYIACKNNQADAVVVYDYVEKTKVAEIPYTFNPDEDVIIRFDEQSNIYIADGAGIHRANMTDASFITLVDSMTSTLGMTSTIVAAMEIDSVGNIWCVAKDYNTDKTDLYCYSCTKIEGNKENLTLYTMKESDWLKKLVIDFQNTYPQYTVNMVIDNEKTMTTQDKLRNLNAQLLSGSGPDIIMLDGLPIDSYIEKGVLTDISECVENSDVLEGIKNNVKTDSGIYAIATRMGIIALLDKQGESKKFESIETLLQALQKKEIYLSAVEADALAELLSVIYYDELFTTDGNLDESKLVSLVEVMKLMKENGYVEEIDEFAQAFMEENGARFGLTCLPVFSWNASMSYDLIVNQANVAVEECCHIPMGVLGIVSKMDIKMSICKNMYLPYGQLGVNSASNNMEAAKQFISFALSEDEQSYYVEDGIPVTYTGLEALTKVKKLNTEMGFTLSDGSELNIKWPKELEISSFTELCKKVDKAQQMENVIVEMIKIQCQNYLTGEASDNEIIENIKNQTKTYIEEQK